MNKNQEGCYYCLNGVEMSDNVQNGDILITQNKKHEYFIVAQSAPSIMNVPSSVQSHRIHFCPFCGRDLDKEYEEYMKSKQ